MSRPHLSHHLWVAQNRRCYLQITAECVAVDGELRPERLVEGGDPRGWTWEHVIPRWVAKRLRSGNLRLLACSPCNGAKGNSLPSPAHIAEAMRINESVPHDHERDLLHMRELVREFYAWLRPAVADDLPVPESVEEALAQGGIVVRRKAA